jgi:AhpD family alkylhydroperoxidase
MSTFRNITPSEATGLNKQLFDGLQSKLGMVPNLAQQLAVAVANENRCDYCLSAHNVLGSLQGLTKPELEAAQFGESADKKDAAILSFALNVVEHRGHLAAEEVETLRAAGVTDQEIVEVIATVAINIFTNYFNHIAGTEIDFPLVRAAEVPTR